MPVFSKFSCGALAIFTLTTSAHATKKRTIVYTKGVTLINNSSISVNLNYCNNYTLNF